MVRLRWGLLASLAISLAATGCGEAVSETFGSPTCPTLEDVSCSPGEPSMDYSVDDASAARAFWSSQGRPGATEVDVAGSLERLVESSDLVVFAQPSRVVGGPTIGIPGEEEDAGPETYDGMEFEVLETFKGEDARSIVVMGLLGTADPFDCCPALLFLKTMPLHEYLPEGEIRDEGDMESDAAVSRLISSQGVFIEIDGVAENPMSVATGPGDPVLEEVVGLGVGDIAHFVELVVHGEDDGGVVPNSSLACSSEPREVEAPAVIQWCAETLISYEYEPSDDRGEALLTEVLEESLLSRFTDEQALHTPLDGTGVSIAAKVDGEQALIDFSPDLLGSVSSDSLDRYMFIAQVSAVVFQFADIDAFTLSVGGDCVPIGELMGSDGCFVHTRAEFESDPEHQFWVLPREIKLLP